MCDSKKLPNRELSPVDVLAFFYNGFGMCGCSETSESIELVATVLEWAKSDKDKMYSDIIENIGAYYIVVGVMDNLGLIEHGTSIRFPWPTKDGERLLDAIRKHGARAIEDASGEAYDGCHYGEF